ncbi:dihydroorotase [Lacticaseibacillus hulanensis]|uniref:dihydroorotase n=1 Tax=Lacticaseibacillus hulanensis TaxID=2493111 RepID=UPI000FDAEB77|nr:dihydroorotase [Lacticaseibacillus hulanensis]
MSKTLLRGGTVNLNGDLVKADLLIDGTKIAAIGTNLAEPDTTEYDVSGMLVTAGLVDLHVHLRDPGQTAKETIKTGSAAAARGGFTTICAMPNVDPVPDSPARIAEMVARNNAEGLVHIKQYSSITHNRTAGATVDFAGVKAAGAVGVSNDGNGIQSADTMLEALLGAKAAGIPLAEHVEEDSLKHGGVISAGAKADELGVKGLIPAVETSQLARDLALAQSADAPYHVCHVSTATSVNMIRAAKAAGVPVTAEATPHHLLLSDSDIPGDDANYKMNPPLRTRKDCAALLEGLLDGTIDCIATDHAPHTDAEKAQGLCGAPNGITGSETAFASLYTAFVRQDQPKCTLIQLLHWLSAAPATLFKLNAGKLLPGGAADIAVFDLEHGHTVTADEFASKGHNNPFIGHKLYGETVYTFVDGQLVYHEGN